MDEPAGAEHVDILKKGNKDKKPEHKTLNTKTLNQTFTSKRTYVAADIIPSWTSPLVPSMLTSIGFPLTSDNTSPTSRDPLFARYEGSRVELSRKAVRLTMPDIASELGSHQTACPNSIKRPLYQRPTVSVFDSIDSLTQERLCPYRVCSTSRKFRRILFAI